MTGEENQRLLAATRRCVDQKLQAVVLTEAIVDEIEIMLVADQRLDGLIECLDPIELEGRVAVGEEIARDDEVILIVVDEEDANDGGLVLSQGCREAVLRSRSSNGRYRA